MDYSQIILELMARIQALEKEVAELKKATPSIPPSPPPQNIIPEPPTPEFSHPPYAPQPGRRDTTRYMFEHNVYLKNRLVLAVVQAYVRDNPCLTCAELKAVFPKSLQGSIGVVESAKIARQRSDCAVRFFTKENETIHLEDGDMYVCTQWGILNIPNFIKCALQLEYNIEAI